MILYLSNFLSRKGRTPQPCELILHKMGDEHNIIARSGRNAYIPRILDEVSAIFRYKNKLQLVVIDLYAYRSFYLACLCGIICSSLKLPYVSVLHSHELEQKFQTRSKLLLRFLKHAQLNICPSEFFYQKITELKLPALIIPNAIELGNYPFSSPELDYPRLLWVRTIHPKYNPQLAINTLHKLIKLFPQSKLTMVGPFTEPEYGNCKLLIKKLHLENSIQFTGYISKKEWLNLVLANNIFINTTNYDNTPVSLIEAAASGLPIVSTNVGGIPHLIEDKKEALLVPPDDSEKMAQAVLDVFRNKTSTTRSNISTGISVETVTFGDTSNGR